MWNDAPLDFKPNDAGIAVLTLTSLSILGPLVVDGLDSLTVSFDEDDFTLTKAASGMTAVNRIRTLSGTVNFDVFAASPSMDQLSAIVNAKKPLALTYTDPNRDGLLVSCTYGFMVKSHDVQMTKETPMNSFSVLCPILKSSDGSFKVVSES